jgi:hypothetical protein
VIYGRGTRERTFDLAHGRRPHAEAHDPKEGEEGEADGLGTVAGGLGVVGGVVARGGAHRAEEESDEQAGLEEQREDSEGHDIFCTASWVSEWESITCGCESRRDRSEEDNRRREHP